MLLGFNMLLWSTHVGAEHSELIEEIKATGYDGIELPIFEGTPEPIFALNRIYWESAKYPSGGVLLSQIVLSVSISCLSFGTQAVVSLLPCCRQR